MILAVRADGDPRGLMAPLRDAIWSVDRDVPISDVQTMEGRIARSIGRPRLMMTLLGTFAALGLLIAALGVYGVVAYSIAQRRREIGIMIALGAGRATVVGSVLREGLVYAAAGLGLGLPAAFAASRLLATLVFGVRPTDPATYAVIAWTIAALVAAACALPACRASRIEPMVVLKE
jgi:ABC-type antimicrobial peptide transport system permease subunit